MFASSRATSLVLIALAVVWTMVGGDLGGRVGPLASEPANSEPEVPETVLLFEPAPAPGAAPAAGATVSDVAIQKTIAALDRRLNANTFFGLFKRIKIEPADRQRIRIRIASPADEAEIARIERLVLSVGTLEFRILATTHRQQYRSYIERARKMDDTQRELRDDHGALLAWWVPVAKGRETGFEQPDIATRKVKRDGREELRVLVVKDPFDVTGAYLTRVQATESMGRPSVSIRFNQVGGQLFGRLTGSHLPDRAQDSRYHLGIILDGRLISAPFIMSTIFDKAELSGDFTRQDVRDLVDVLNAGSLPVGLRKVPADKQSPEKPAG